MKYVESLSHHNCMWYSDSILFQVYMMTTFEVTSQNVFSHARIMVIGVSKDLKCPMRKSILQTIESLAFYRFHEKNIIFFETFLWSFLWAILHLGCLMSCYYYKCLKCIRYMCKWVYGFSRRYGKIFHELKRYYCASMHVHFVHCKTLDIIC